MAAINCRKLWTAFVGMLVTLGAALGFAKPATAARTSQLPQTPQASPEPAATTSTDGSDAPLGLLPEQRILARNAPMPPTMKQRIGAEAHGSAPSARNRPAHDPAEATETADPATEDQLVPAGG